MNPVINIKYGFSTNSSSSHSIAFFTDPDGIAAAARASDDDNVEFGWDNFTVGTRTSKLRYLTALVASNLSACGFPGAVIPSIVKSLIPELPMDADHLREVELGHVDHQSCMALPVRWLRGWSKELPVVDTEYLDELKRWILREGVVILGDNDNKEEGDGNHPLLGYATSPAPEFVIDNPRADLVCRKEGLGANGFHNWSLFSRVDGTRTRLQLSSAPFVSASPELIDIKITDKCFQGCAFCYQNSTPVGLHAETHILSELVDRLAEMQVFEVAIGGGEPTLHPWFHVLLAYLHRAGITPNFTTRRLDWLYDNTAAGRNIRKEVIDSIGGFAYSVDSLGDIQDLIDAVKSAGIHTGTGSPECRKVSIHMVLGLVNEYSFKSMIEMAQENRLGVTLLGYKTAGRGQTFLDVERRGGGRIIKPEWFVEALKDVSGYGVGVDTSIIQLYQRELEEAGLRQWTATAEEGQHSCYIDAVAGTMSESSWGGTPVSILRPTGDRRVGYEQEIAPTEELLRVFRGFRTPPPRETNNVRGFAE